MNNIGEQHRHLLVLRGCGEGDHSRSALVAELVARSQFNTAGPARQPSRGDVITPHMRRAPRIRRGTNTPSRGSATLRRIVHVSIVSSLVGRRVHIARRSAPTGAAGNMQTREIASSGNRIVTVEAADQGSCPHVQRSCAKHRWNSEGSVHVCTSMNGWSNRAIPCRCRRCEPPTPGRDFMDSSGPPPDGVAVSNPSGTLTVWLSPTGLPVRVEIARSLLSRGADAVAGEVLRLCRRRG